MQYKTGKQETELFIYQACLYFKWNHQSFGLFPKSNLVLKNRNLSVSPSVIYPHLLFVHCVNRCTAEKVNLIPSLPAYLALKHLWLWRCNTSNWICPGRTVKYSRMELIFVVFKMCTYTQSSWETYKLQQDNSNSARKSDRHFSMETTKTSLQVLFRLHFKNVT